MSTFVMVAGGHQPIMDWIEDHGLDPADTSCRIEFNDDATITLRRFQRDADGKLILVAANTCQHCGWSGDEDGYEASTIPVVVTPKHPFPILP